MLEIVRSNRLEALLDALGERLAAEPILDPMRSEWIVVPSRGMERWLSQRLSQRLGRDAANRLDGICAHVEFPFPGRVARQALELADPQLAEAGLHDDPWNRESLAWYILAALREGLESRDESFDALRSYLDYEAGPAFEHGIDRRAFGLAVQVASVFDRYAQHRPDIIARLREPRRDDPHYGALVWQSALWRAVEEQIGVEPFSLASQRGQALLRQGNAPLEGLAPRLSFFGFASMAPAWLTTFDALSGHLPCQFYVLTPTAAYWADTRSRKQLLRNGAEVLDAEGLAAAEGHPLLASSGKVAREFQAVVVDCIESYGEGRDCFVDPLEQAEHALAHLQSDLLHLRNRELDTPDAPVVPLQPDDVSIRVHACYGRMRQVEVLRETILEALDRDPSLSCRDILVMSPDIESFAPLIEAVFERGELHSQSKQGWEGPTGTPRLRINIADRVHHSRDPLIRAVIDLLGLVKARRTLIEIIDLLAHELIRERFDIDAQEVDKLLSWSKEAGARWGSDAGHRASFDQPAHATHTWRGALDRMALGVTMSSDGGDWQGLSPFDPIEGQSVDLFAKFSDFCERLFDGLAGLVAPRPLSAWAETIEAFARDMLALDEVEAWRGQRLSAALSGLSDMGRIADGDEPSSEDEPLLVDLDVVTRMIVDRVDGGANAIGQQGAITFCAMAPMRSIPHRMVCLLGMDHGDFPRAQRQDAFDLMKRTPRLGDPDPRDAERFLFVEALLAARDRFVITYAGRDPSRGESRPPANVVRELLEHLGHAFRTDSGGAFWLEEHLHAHDPRYFGETPLRYDAKHLHAAQASLTRRGPQEAALPDALSDEAQLTELDLDLLVRALEHPARHHAQQRLGIYFPREEDELPEREALELGALENYALLQAVLRIDPRAESLAFAPLADDPVEEQAALAGADLLPPGTPGAYAFAEALAKRESLQAQLDGYAPEELRTHSEELRVEVDGVLVHGRIQTHGEGTRLLIHHSGSVSPKRDLRAWVEHVAWQASTPDEVESAWLRVDKVNPAPLPTLSQEQARETLSQLVALYRRNHARPLPFFPEASHAFVKKGLKGEPEKDERLDASQDAYAREEDNFARAGEGHDPYNEMLWGPPRDGVAIHHDDAFSEHAESVWGPRLRLPARKIRRK